MKTFILTISLTLFGLINLMGQHEAILTHYHINPILINPAAAGFNEQHELMLNARGSWTGFVDAPRNFNINYNGPIGNRFGLVLAVLTESAAQLSTIRGRGNFAFRFPINDKLKIAAGVAAEYEQMSIDNGVTLSNFFEEGDRILESALNGEGDFDAAVSLYGSLNDRTFGGLIFTNLVQSKLDDIVATSQNSFLNFFMFHLGHRFDIPELKFSLTPSVLIRQLKDAPNQLDLNVNAGFLDDQLIAGLSYRNLRAMGVLFGTKLSNFYLYYSYDLSFQNFQQYNSGSHEVTLAFTFKRKNVPGKGDGLGENTVNGKNK